MMGDASSGWKTRVVAGTAPTNLSPIGGWQEQPLVTLSKATSKLPVPKIAAHTKLALEFARDYKRRNPGDLRTPDQLGAVNLYSHQWAEPQESLYKILNQALSCTDRSLMKVWLLYLKLLMSAIMVEKPFAGTVLRGVPENLEAEYPKGEQFRWWRFSSCTENGNVLHNPLFCGDQGERTVFTITCATGVKVRHLSTFEGEEEVLLPAGTRFEVTQSMKTGDVTLVSLREVDSWNSHYSENDDVDCFVNPVSQSGTDASGNNIAIGPIQTKPRCGLGRRRASLFLCVVIGMAGMLLALAVAIVAFENGSAPAAPAVPGCTQSNALNFDAAATKDDLSCVFGFCNSTVCNNNGRCLIVGLPPEPCSDSTIWRSVLEQPCDQYGTGRINHGFCEKDQSRAGVLASKACPVACESCPPPREMTRCQCFGSSCSDRCQQSDACGVCGGNNDTCRDCAGINYGLSKMDRCGQCDADAGNDCKKDCKGVWGGKDGSCRDCAGVNNGAAKMDHCGQCDADTGNDCKKDCKGVWGGRAQCKFSGFPNSKILTKASWGVQINSWLPSSAYIVAIYSGVSAAQR
eukprot:COSAG01_NODE_4424_length_5036_cov_12.613936_3_plen_574_part_00